MIPQISLILPSYNNLQHIQNAYTSILKHAPEAEIILLDDGSTDGTWEWMQTVETLPNNKTRIIRSEERVGHTILYDKGIELATSEIVGIIHADMILGPNYIENLVKHIKPGTVVCGTRIEPPLHPEGKEKIIRDFGMDFDTLDIDAFETFVAEAQIEFKDQTTKGMFAPWIIYKKDFQAIGGHDPLFAPFPYEDSDIFQRWILAGYELIQSRDAFVYHLTCRGHRWNDKVGTDDDYFKIVSKRAQRNYLRKWKSWIKNDEFQYPIIPPVYNIAYAVKNCNLALLEAFEPWCDRIYIEDEMQVLYSHYLDQEQHNTTYDLSKRVMCIGHNDPISENDIVIEFDAKQLTTDSIHILHCFPQIIKDGPGFTGDFEADIFKVHIQHLEDLSHTLINL
jgi:glycosyltransferase involved in cell wall biosynthesis